jgi:hypothetical protein
MSKVVTVEYDAAEKVLRLEEPLEGVANHARFQATLEKAATADRWAALRRSVTEEQLDELAAIIEDEFPTER